MNTPFFLQRGTESFFFLFILFMLVIVAYIQSIHFIHDGAHAPKPQLFVRDTLYSLRRSSVLSHDPCPPSYVKCKSMTSSGSRC
ncbi:hypothetical protein PIL02S_02581 [Paenibacillus illinoisensis]|uniref:Uncharacterized protein n=1 Tax=Paenibacillus illinoisensis TaxID=59845 RepID=A0A2W0D125_9BACL|nr:hypothetical protein PIL02S_02581 [Paenibacillus illinoisensis]